MTNPLDAVLDWYNVARDSMRVTARVLDKDPRNIITNRHVFYAQPVNQAKEQLEEAKERLDDLVVLAFAATFERALRDYLKQLGTNLITPGDALNDLVRAAVQDDVEFWKNSERLIEVFKPRASPNLIGQVKQIMDFRNWVAHGRRTDRPAPSNVVPQFAYRTLSDFLSAAGLV